LMHLKEDLDGVFKVFNKILEKITRLTNDLTKGTIFLDELISGIASIRSVYENFKLMQGLSTELNINFDISDPKTLRNETLNIKEFEERLNTLKKILPLSPKSQKEFASLSENWESYKNGKLNGQIIEIYRLKIDSAYYYVKIPETKIPHEIHESINLNLNKCKNFLNTCIEQKNEFRACFFDYSKFYNSLIEQIDCKIEIRKKKDKLLDDIQSIYGSGESQTEKIYQLAKQFMYVEGLKGVLMIAHKDRHRSEVTNCPIVETEFYVVYLGILSGWVKMKSFQGGFLNLATFYYRGYENWRFGGMGGFPTPSIEDNGIKVVNVEELQKSIEQMGKMIEIYFKKK